MNHKRFFLITALLNHIMEFIPAAIILMEVTYYITEEMKSLVYIGFLIPVPILCYLANRYLKKLWIFLPAVFAVFLVYAGILSRIGKIQLVLSIFYFIYIAVQTFIRVGEEHPTTSRNISLFLLVIPILAMLVNLFKEYGELNRLVSAIMAVGILLFLLNHYLLNFNAYFSVYHEVKGVPYRQMRSSNHLLIGLFFIICLGGMGLAILIPMQTILSVVGSFLFRVLKALIRLLLGGEEETAPAVEKEPLTEDEFFNLVEQEQETAQWIQVLGQILYWLAIIALVVGAVFLLGYALYRLYRYFYQRNIDIRDTVEQVTSKDIRESFYSDKKNRHKINKWDKKPGRFFTGNSEKIRRVFIMTVQKLAPEEIPKSLTPEELLFYQAESHGLLKEAPKERPHEVVEELVRLYHKARYSEFSCTGEDVKKAKRCYHILCAE